MSVKLYAYFSRLANEKCNKFSEKLQFFFPLKIEFLITYVLNTQSI
jgi:hypothetical protein